MVELPEVYVLAEQMNRVLEGKRIKNVVALRVPIR